MLPISRKLLTGNFKGMIVKLTLAALHAGFGKLGEQDRLILTTNVKAAGRKAVKSAVQRAVQIELCVAEQVEREAFQAAMAAQSVPQPSPDGPRAHAVEVEVEVPTEDEGDSEADAEADSDYHPESERERERERESDPESERESERPRPSARKKGSAKASSSRGAGAAVPPNPAATRPKSRAKEEVKAVHRQTLKGLGLETRLFTHWTEVLKAHVLARLNEASAGKRGPANKKEFMCDQARIWLGTNLQQVSFCLKDLEQKKLFVKVLISLGLKASVAKGSISLDP